MVSNLRNLALILFNSEVNLQFILGQKSEIIPENIKSSESVDIFKSKTKK